MLGVALALLLAAGCGGGDRLESCPRGDRPWRRAVDRASRQGTLEDLERRLEGLAAGHATRWEPQWARGLVALRQRRLEPARAFWRQARELARRQDDAVGIAASSNWLAWTLFQAGELQRAEPLYEEALVAARRAGRRDLEAYALNNLAGLLKATERLAAAGDRLSRAVRLLEATGRPDAAARARFNRATLLYDLGDLRGAEEACREVVEGPVGQVPPSTRASARLVLGSISLAEGHPSEAAEWFEPVLDAEPRLAVRARLGLAEVALLGDDLEAAGALLDRALEEARRESLSVLARKATLLEAEVAASGGHPGRARERLEGLLAAARDSGDVWAEISAGTALARQHRRAGRQTRAIELLEQTVSLFEREGSQLDPTALGLRYLRQRLEPYALLAESLVARAEARGASPPVAEVFRLVEAAHARALRRVLGAAPAGSGLDAILASLPPETAIVNYLVGQEAGVAVVLRRDGARAVVLGGAAGRRAALERYRLALRRPLLSAEARLDPLADFQRDVPAGAALSRWLIAPLAPLLVGARRVLIVPDGELALLPFAALPWPLSEASADGGGYPPFLGQQYEIGRLPLAMVPPPARVVRGPVLLAGNPVDAAGGLPALPRAAEEMRRLAALWSRQGVEPLEGSDLSLGKIAGLDLTRYGIVHFATHAEASSRDPRRTAVLLSGGQRLGLDRIGAWKLDADLVVLSGCRTGDGEVVPGEGVVGLGWAFFRAGARDLVVSLWSVADGAAADEMVLFHQELARGADPVAALARARRAAAGLRPHPAFWAPFVAYLGPEAATCTKRPKN